MNDITQSLRNLSIEDLHLWADGKIFHRGKGYIQQVSQLSRIGEDSLAAWVSGSYPYVTSVTFDEDGDMLHSCTCPYDWGPCKHAVAVILAAAEMVKANQSIPVLDRDSELGQYLQDEGEFDWEDENDTSAPGGIGEILAAKDRDELIELLMELARRFPQVAQHISESKQLADGQVNRLVRDLKTEINQLTAEPVWLRIPDHREHPFRFIVNTDSGGT